MTRDDVTRDEEKDDRPAVDEDAQSGGPGAQSGEPDAAEAVASGEGAGAEPGGGEQTDVDAEPASAGEGMLSLDDLLSGEQGTSCSIDGTCD